MATLVLPEHDRGEIVVGQHQVRRSPRYRPLRVAVDAAALVYDEAGVHPVRLRNLSRCGVVAPMPSSIARRNPAHRSFTSRP